MALAAVAAGADGLMIEVHPDPRNAAVDPLQPLDYAQFADLARGVAATRSATRA
jgi:3-deoxy-7-phosphoheptulonate synthase